MATIILTIPSRGQVVAVPSGELVWRPPHSGALVLSLPVALLPPAVLPPTLVPPVPDTIAERLCAQSAILPPNTMVYAPPLVIGERQACTLQMVGPGMPTRYCRCVIPCLRLKPRNALTSIAVPVRSIHPPVPIPS
ncbi:hypothetical protein C8R44DRAFT_864615 [Mycena epipterygia]|nr:hypothetical protein C8R44DRAFT_864615 [Mycena epipterygia]